MKPIKLKLKKNPKPVIQKTTTIMHVDFKTRLVTKATVCYNTLGQRVEADQWVVEKFNLMLYKKRKAA